MKDEEGTKSWERKDNRPNKICKEHTKNGQWHQEHKNGRNMMTTKKGEWMDETRWQQKDERWRRDEIMGTKRQQADQTRYAKSIQRTDNGTKNTKKQTSANDCKETNWAFVRRENIIKRYWNQRYLLL